MEMQMLDLLLSVLFIANHIHIYTLPKVLILSGMPEEVQIHKMK